MTIKPFILTLVIAILSINCASASHIVGGEIGYSFISFNASANTVTYRISLVIYQDCITGDQAAIAADFPPFLGFFTGTGDRIFFNGNAEDEITQVKSNERVPANFSNSCVNNPPLTCLNKVTWEKVYTLPYSPSGYKVVHQRCCRNGSIINISKPGSTGASYYCTIPPIESAAFNTSATFKNYPPQIICINDPLYYDHSATDADGDSLSYELCEAYTGGSPNNAKPNVMMPPPFTPVAYVGSHQPGRPMAGKPLVQINPNTGLITGTPNLLGRFVVAVCCNEWRNGKLINTATREFQFVVTNCSKAVVADMPQYSQEINTYIVQCKGFDVAFKNTSKGGFAYSWNFGTGNPADVSTDFEPVFTYPDTGVYKVTLVVNRGSTCPDSISKFVKIFPVFKTDYANDGLPCPNTLMSFTDLSEATYKPIIEWAWNFGDGTSSTEKDPSHSFSRGGNYTVTLVSRSAFGCIDTMKRDIFIEDFVPFAGNDTIIVKGEYLNFNARGGMEYTWTPATHLNNANIGNPTGYYPDTTRLDYMVHIKSAYGCEGDDDINVWVVAQPSVFVPSGFTPNGDGVNDELKPIGIGFKSLDYFRVLNRWGQVMYESDRFKVGWDGRWNGEPQQLGTYFWQLKMTDRFGKDMFYKGDAALIR